MKKKQFFTLPNPLLSFALSLFLVIVRLTEKGFPY